MMITVLLLTANPAGLTRLRLDQEVREILETLRGTKYRDNLTIVSRPAVRVKDLQPYLLDHNPQIVHFSGHTSESSEIILEDDQGSYKPVSIQALAGLFSLFKDNLRCVILNSCFSEQQARAIAEHVDWVIGMSGAVTDEASIAFSAAFYQALGSDKDVQHAFDLACNRIALEGLKEKDKPQLIKSQRVIDADKFPNLSSNSQSNKYVEIVDSIKRLSDLWKQADYPSSRHFVLDKNTFLAANSHMDRLAEMDKEQKAFLLWCAVYYGKWGPWLLTNKDNVLIVYPLFVALNGVAGQRLVWRASYILECTFGKEIEPLRAKYNNAISQFSKIQLALNTIVEIGVLSHLDQLIQSDDKAKDVIGEIQGFRKEVLEYQQVQTVQAQWLALR